MSYLKTHLFFKRILVLLTAFVLSSVLILSISRSSTPVFTAADTRTLPYDLVYVPEAIRELEANITMEKGILGWEPGWSQTSDFMIGTVAVSVILPSCNGQIDPCSQGGWSSSEVNLVLSEVQNALNWWEARATDAGTSVDFHIVTGSPLIVPTNYEPIDRPGGGASLCGEEGLWIDNVMANLGYNDYPPGGNSYLLEVREYDNELRNQNNTDWAFTIFVADSSNNPGGMFDLTDCGGQTNPFAVAAWAYLAGPFFVMNTINNGYGSIFMDGVAAHELGHIFGAPDEVASSICQQNQAPTCNTKFGYLGGENQNCNPCLFSGCNNPCALDVPLSMMRFPEDFLTGQIQNVIHVYTEQQIGWQDSDNDGLPDPIDTSPNLTLVSPPSPTTNNSPLYTGSTQDIPFPSTLPFPEPWRPAYPDETINKIAGVEFRVNNSQWLLASPSDGAFNSGMENFFFSPLFCTAGTYTVQVRAVNSVGNYSSITTHMIIVQPSETCNYSYLPIIYSSNLSLLESPTTLLSDSYPGPSESVVPTPTAQSPSGGYPSP
ncbi:MAG: hypothetical protein KA314_27490 [Chloroflexi bacterium]|nr:hypothetical protein [Chloroflexota bacterium]